jgi:hypothetical protein
MLLGMSVIGRIGLVPNPYKGTLKYYVDWETRGSRLTYLACVFDVQLSSKNKKSVRSTACEEVDRRSALAMPMMAMPRKDFECWANRLQYQDYCKQLVDESSNNSSQLALSSLKEMETKPSLNSLEGYKYLRPLNQDIVNITEPLMYRGLVVVELCGGILSATKALLRIGVKIRELHICTKSLCPLFFFSFLRHCIDQAAGRWSIGACRLDHLRVSMSRLFTSLKKGTRTKRSSFRCFL